MTRWRVACMVVAALMVVAAVGVAASAQCYEDIRLSGFTGAAAWANNIRIPYLWQQFGYPAWTTRGSLGQSIGIYRMSWEDAWLITMEGLPGYAPNALAGWRVDDAGPVPLMPPARGWVQYLFLPGDPMGKPRLRDGDPISCRLFFVPAYPATDNTEWSLLTRPVPTVTGADGQTEYLPVVYSFGEPIEVRFMLEDGDGRAVLDADITLGLWKYTAGYEVGNSQRIMAFDISYDSDAKAYATVVPTDGPDFKLLPGLYEWHLMTSTGEELAELRMVIE